MTQLNSLISGILFVLIMNFIPYGHVFSQKAQSDSDIKGIDLSKKRYYEQIFTKDERKQLKKADTYLESAKKEMLSYNSDRAEIEKQYAIADASGNVKSRDKAMKKARKLEQKSIKTGNNALDLYKKGNDIKTTIYTSAINRNRLRDNSKRALLGQELELRAKANFENSKTKIRTAPLHDQFLKFMALNEANNLTIKALELQENAFALYANDPQIKPEDFVEPVDPNKEKVQTGKEQDIKTVTDPKKVVPIDTVLFPIYVEQYNPLTDQNLYKSKADIIIPRLKLSTEEKAEINESSRKNKHANDLLKQVDEAYIIIDSLHYTADRTPDFTTRDRLRNRAAENELHAFYKLTNATDIHRQVNETRYKIYKAHFPKVDSKKMTPELEKAKQYEMEAETYFLKAQNEIAQANKLQFAHEQYIQKMGANDMLLYALQLQENAYGIYFNLPGLITVIPDTSKVTINKPVITKKPNVKEKSSETLKWNVAKTYTYSKEKPKAVTYTVKNGVVFLVQLGVFKGILPADKLGNVQPVVFDEFLDNPNRRFLAGEYRTTEAAEAALELMKKAGYDEAYIISLVNGVRRNYAEGKQAIKSKESNYNNLKNNELAKLAGEKPVIIDNGETQIISTSSIESQNIKKTKGLVYLVQLGMFAKPITLAELKNLQPIYIDVIPNRGTRYMMGTYTTLERAREETQRAINAGMPDAYVIAYHNGSHISLDKAKALEGKSAPVKDNKVVAVSSITYMVQVGAYREKLNASDENKLRTTYAPRKVDVRISDGMNIYLIGNFKTYNEADLLKKKLISEGNAGVFVVAFNGKQKITVEQALKMNKNQ
jgi:hypothetical protein